MEIESLHNSFVIIFTLRENGNLPAYLLDFGPMKGEQFACQLQFHLVSAKPPQHHFCRGK